MISQAEFTAGLLDPARPAPDGLTDGAGVPTTKRFNVYRNNVAVSLTEALIAAFPVIYKLVGDEFFRAMAGVYLRLHPPASPLMMHYGQEMPKFLMRFGPAKALPYLPDMARLELAMRESYHAADASPISPDALSALSPDELMAARVTLAPAVTFISSSHPIFGIYAMNTRAEAPRPGKDGETVLITRAQFDPEQHLITEADAEFLTALRAHHSLGVALSKAGPGFDLGSLLGLLLRQNAVTALH